MTYGGGVSPVVQSQNVVSAHFTSKQILPFCFGEQHNGGLNVIRLAVSHKTSQLEHI